jgi:protein arginine kinase activator
VTTCQACHLHPAVVHLTQVAGDQSVTIHLCGRCAAERGINQGATSVDTPLAAFLAGIPVISPGPDLPQSIPSCPSCDATLADFRASLRLGCADCWTTFERPLRDLLRRMHGATVHTGRVPEDPGDEEGLRVRRLAQQRIRLRQALQDAIAAEEFERAAEIRDQLRAMEDER